MDVPESVERAYGGTRFRFGRDYLIPTPFDPRIMLWVAPAVAKAAMETGVARITLDLAEYRQQLEGRLGRGREVMRDIMNRARRDPRRIVFPEGEHERVIRAAALVVGEGIAEPILLGRPERIARTAEALGASLEGVRIVDRLADDAQLERYAQLLYARRWRKGMTLADAQAEVRRAVPFGCMMVNEGEADGLVAGEDMYYPETIRPALQVVGTAPGVSHVAGLYMMIMENDLMFFADTTVNIDPDAETLAEIATLSAAFVRRLGLVPRVAMLSFSNFGSSRSPQAGRVRRAADLVKAREPGLEIDGEMQVEAAVDPELRRSVYPHSTLTGAPNVLIFPNLDAANIAYKLMMKLGKVEAFGPILLGMAHPIHVLQRRSEAVEIANLTALAVVDAQERGERQG
ncbi:MAG TPA: phosphate acyltransferase [Longimicrobium sp.]